MLARVVVKLGEQLVSPEYIGAHGTGHQQCGGGAQTAANGDVGINVDLDTPNLFTHGVQHSTVRGVDQNMLKCLIMRNILKNNTA